MRRVRLLLRVFGWVVVLWVWPAVQSFGQAFSPGEVFVRFRETAEFKHLSEYFTGEEVTHGALLLRTQPEQRAGLYFAFRSPEEVGSAPGIGGENVTEGRFILEAVGGHSPEVERFVFPVTEFPAPGQRVYLALTGEDWPVRTRTLLAWKISFQSSAGRELLRRQSFAWALEE
jgi:hypothetical protein